MVASSPSHRGEVSEIAVAAGMFLHALQEGALLIDRHGKEIAKDVGSTLYEGHNYHAEAAEVREVVLA